jgi:ParB/RepB/Spo0J family partition protein
MASSTEVARGLPLERIHVPANVRELDPEHVQALAGSIRLQGMLVPVVVRPAAEGFELVAGFHRVAAARSLGLVQVPAVVRDGETEDADRAVENITRKQLNPYEEARAVKAMLDRGLTEDGAAQALGWARARVTARVKVLELPERAQQLVGTGLIPLSAVDQLRAIGAVAPGLLDAVVAFIDDGNEWAAERLAREPGWVLDSAIRHGGAKTFAAYLNSVDPREIAELRLGKRAEAQLAEAERLHKQLDSYAYGPPQIRFVEGNVDQARAAGVLIEFEQGTAGHRRSPALPRARQGRAQAHRRRADSQGCRGGGGAEARMARRQAASRPAHRRPARARPPVARAGRPGPRRQPRPRRRAADRAVDR